MLTSNALEVLNKRYFLKDNTGKVIENWEGLCERVANHVSKDETTAKLRKEWKQNYYDLIYDLKFLPNSPTMMNAGKDNPMLSACFVLPIQDSIEDIMDTAKHMALIQKSGGGNGFNFGNIRPQNSIVASTTGVASGPVSFMTMLNDICEQIKQGGTRRGANMGLLPVHHPDILTFIDCKQDTAKITNFNISILATDVFMEAVREDKEYDIIDPQSGNVVKKLRAKMVFDKIVSNAHQTGEPGLFFVDTVNQTNEYPEEPIDACNPCGESPLRGYESCNLGSINLSKYYDGRFNWKELEKDTRTATRFLDSIISVNKYPLPIIKKETEKTRKIGLGIMGFADLLYMMDVRYGSNESYVWAEKIMKFLNDISIDESEKLGKEKGMCPVLDGRRNLWTTIIAPTGTISIIADASSGCEPVFDVAHMRTCMDDTRMEVFNHIFKKRLEEFDIELTKELKKKLFESKSLADIKEIPKELKDIFVSSADIKYDEHVKMQASFQKYVHGGVSKTINLQTNATKIEVAASFLLAHELGCKGITVYRDGSRPNQVLSSVPTLAPKIRYRSRVLSGTTEKFETPLGNLYLTVNRNKPEEEPIEVMAQIGKSGGITLSFMEAMGRLISTGLKYKVPISRLAKCLKGIKASENASFDGHRKIRYDSIPDLIGKELERLSKETIEEEKFYNECPKCGDTLRKEEGCTKCSCGYSRC